MVEWWTVRRLSAIAVTKFRIKYFEKNGCGLNAIKEKAILKKQERHRDIMEGKV